MAYRRKLIKKRTPQNCLQGVVLKMVAIQKDLQIQITVQTIVQNLVQINLQKPLEGWHGSGRCPINFSLLSIPNNDKLKFIGYLRTRKLLKNRGC